MDPDEHLSTAGESENLHRHFENQYGILRKLRINLPHNPAIPILGKCAKGAQPYQKDTCSTIFIAILFMIARTMESTLLSPKKRVDKEFVAHLQNGALFGY